MDDLFTILGVPPNGSDDDIRRAYRIAARRLHPDVNSNPGAAYQFRDITAAYEVLSDPLQRAAYIQRYNDEPRGRAYFTLRITPSKRVLTALPEPQVLYLLVELVPDRTLDRSKATAPINLCLVIDRSTSMQGVRLERTKAAAHQIIDLLSEQDVVSVVSFSDRADVMWKAATLREKNAAKVMVTTIQASGGTEIYQGLQAGYDEVLKFKSDHFVNHLILITDGRTFGDEELCIDLAKRAAKEGVGISAMGFGEEWNDTFLDRLASLSGGHCEYIKSPGAVIRFLNERVRALTDALAERVTLSVAPDPDIRIESAFRLTPSPQPIDPGIDPVQLGQLQAKLNTSVLIQLQMPALSHVGFRSLLRIQVSGDVLWEKRQRYQLAADTSIEISAASPQEEPPVLIVDALGKLTLYRMQQKANESLQQGNVKEATQRLEHLATRLFDAGHEALANEAMAEARRVQQTQNLSETGKKNLKYGTRMLLLSAPKDSER